MTLVNQDVSSPTSATLPAGVDVIIRFHDVQRLYELDRALLSLACQSAAPVRAIVVAQNFDEERILQLRELSAKYDWEIFGQPEPLIVNAIVPAGDQRSALLNIGLQNTKYRFVAFLDADDYVYEDCYEYLMGEALKDGAAIAFGGIVIKEVLGLKSFIYNHALHKDRFNGKDFNDLLKANFCPIHSFVIDREQVSSEYLRFDERLTRLEDYELLLRVCGNHRSLFETRQKFVGVYNWHLDGKNSFVFSSDGSEAPVDKDKEAAWVQARRIIWRVKTDLREKLKLIPI